MKVKRSVTKEQQQSEIRLSQFLSSHNNKPIVQNIIKTYHYRDLDDLQKTIQKKFQYSPLFPHKQPKSQLSFMLPRINKSTAQENGRTKYHSLILKQKTSFKIPLKPVPKQNIKSTNIFGWVIDKNDISIKQQLVINKGSKSYSVESQKYKNQWLNTLKQANKQFETVSPKLKILPFQFWSYILSKFENFHLHVDQKVQLMELMSKFLEFRLKKSNQKNELQFCQQMGTKFQKMQNRIYFKHKYSLQYAKFMIAQNIHKEKFYPIHFYENKFDLDEKEVFELFGIVRKFCQNNMDAFAFITLYFQISLKNKLKSQSFKKVEEQFVKLTDILSKKYPPSEEPKDESNNSYGLQNIPCTYKFQMIKFNSNSKKSHYEQLRQLIIKKIQDAKQDQTLFRQLVQDVCFKYGYSFKCGVKIKSAQSKASIFRTIEKLLSKNKFKNQFINLKKQIASSSSQNEKFSLQRIRIEIQKGEKKICQILQKQDLLQIDAKDLVRGKCTFSRIEQIVQTVKLLKQHITNQGFRIIELKNRLRKQTKDVSLIIKLPRSVAQLQLALKLDSVSNQFNHKIFQLTRSQIHTPITNLFIHNQRWCEIFFTDQFQLFEQIVNMNRQPQLKDEITFRRLKKDIALFKKDFLEPNGIKYEKNFHLKQQEKSKIVVKIKQIKKLSDRIKIFPGSQNQIKISQKQNLISFYKTFDYQNALDSVEAIQQKQLQENLTLMKLKGDIMKHHGKYKQSLQCYEKYVKIQKKIKQNSIQLAKVLYSIGLVHDIQQQYNSAIGYYQQSLEIVEKQKGQDTIQVAISYSGIGQAYSNMKIKQNYIKSLQYHDKALKIRQNCLGKQSVQVATSLNDIGVVYRRLGEYEKSLEYLKQSLEIKQKILGKQSLDAATSLYHIGVVYRFKKDGVRALEYLNKAVQIKQKILGKQSVDIAKAYFEISYVYEQMDELQKAERSILMAYQIFKKILGDEHGKSKLSYEQYKDIRQKINRKQKGDFLGSKIFKSIRSEQFKYSMQQ